MWSSDGFSDCCCCLIRDQQIAENVELLTIHLKHVNETDADVEIVDFIGGDVTKMLKVIHKTTKQQILRVQLWMTNSRMLNSQFFGDISESAF